MDTQLILGSKIIFMFIKLNQANCKTTDILRIIQMSKKELEKKKSDYIGKKKH